MRGQERTFVDVFDTAQAQALRQTMAEAYTVLCQAHVSYQHSMSIAVDTHSSTGGALALKREGRVYAAALTRYSEAAMAWLMFVDVLLHSKNPGSAGGRPLD
jgi:hypothetical protein